VLFALLCRFLSHASSSLTFHTRRRYFMTLARGLSHSDIVRYFATRNLREFLRREEDLKRVPRERRRERRATASPKFRPVCPRKKASSAESRVRCGKCIIEGCVYVRREKDRPAPHRRAGSSNIYLTRPLNILSSAIHSEYSPVMPIVVTLPRCSGYTGCR
jgi:hypothetical protein